MAKWDGHERRKETDDGREGRRQADWHCGEHYEIQNHTKEHRDSVCTKIKEVKGNLTIEVDKLEKALNNMMPKWVMLWVGIPSLLGMLMFVSWVSLKGISNTEAIIEMKAEQKATSANVVQLMKHFDLTPVPVKPKP
jgi:hypothetical protein